MPWGKRKLASGKYQVYKKTTGENLGPPKTEAAANKYLAALHANVNEIERGATTMAHSVHHRKRK